MDTKKEKFLKKHLCRACKQPMSYMGGNIMTCQNPECKGIPVGNDKYIVSYELLDEIGEKIASTVF